MTLSFLNRAGMEIYAYLALHGYELTTYKSYEIALKNIEKFFCMHRVFNYSYELMEKFREEIVFRRKNGTLGRNFFHIFIRVSHYVDNYFRGDVLTKLPCMDSENECAPETVHIPDVPYEGSNVDLVDGFLETASYGPLVSQKARNSILLFMSFVESEGWTRENLIRLENLSRFMITYGNDTKCLKEMVKYIKAYMIFLCEKGMGEPVPSSFIRIKSKKTIPVLPCFSYEDLEKMFMALDPTTEEGSREYAVIMMALCTGMRGCDICNMRLSDVHFDDHTISLRQMKTKAFYELPMLDPLEEALKNYLKYRKDSDFDNFFTTPRGNAYRNLRGILGRLLDAAGLAQGQSSGHSFHAFRRCAALWLIESGSTPEMISMILGHTSPHAFRRYIPLSDKSLEICCLSLSELGCPQEACR